MPLPLRRFVRELGALRALLALLALLVIAAAPLSEGGAVYSGWRLATTVVAPALFVMLVFVVPLDVVMSALFRSGAEGAERARFTRIIVAELVLLALLLLAWTPFVSRLLDPPF